MAEFGDEFDDIALRKANLKDFKKMMKMILVLCSIDDANFAISWLIWYLDLYKSR